MEVDLIDQHIACAPLGKQMPLLKAPAQHPYSRRPPCVLHDFDLRFCFCDALDTDWWGFATVSIDGSGRGVLFSTHEPAIF